MSVVSNLKNRLGLNNIDNESFENNSSLSKMQKRLMARGGTDQWTRMRQDKLKSLEKALLYSYQSAIVQKYNVQNDTLANNIISIITLLQDNQELSDTQIALLDVLETEYTFTTDDRTSLEYIDNLNDILDEITTSEPLFRCLINHDKLKVDYEDKIISIPFLEVPVGSHEPQETNFHNGTVFKWVHGNKEEWTPDTYWIVYMQYSEETAYFRGEIRKADQEIEIITIDDQGNEHSVTYRGWMTGPNETVAIWNTKRGVTWNDLNYTKLLYITKDADTLAFFQRFERIVINGKPWEVQAYNDNYSTSKVGDADSGIIRVALKETYTSTDQFVDETIQALEAEKEAKEEYDKIHTQARIEGPTSAEPYGKMTFVAKNFKPRYDDYGNLIPNYWTLYGTSLAEIIYTSSDGKTITVQIKTGKSNKEGFYVNYGPSQDTKVHVVIGSL